MRTLQLHLNLLLQSHQELLADLTIILLTKPGGLSLKRHALVEVALLEREERVEAINVDQLL